MLTAIIFKKPILLTERKLRNFSILKLYITASDEELANRFYRALPQHEKEATFFRQTMYVERMLLLFHSVVKDRFYLFTVKTCIDTLISFLSSLFVLLFISSRQN